MNSQLGLAQVRWDEVGLGIQDPSFSSISGEGQGSRGCLCLQDGPQETMGAFLCWGW